MIFHFGRFSLEESKRELRLGDRVLELQPRVFDLLVYLLRNHDRVVPKEELLNAPIITDLDQAALLRLVDNMLAPAYIASPPLFPVLVLLQVKLSLDYGSTRSTSYYFTTYGLILTIMFGKLEAGYEMGALGVTLQRRLNDPGIGAKVDGEVEIVFEQAEVFVAGAVKWFDAGCDFDRFFNLFQVRIDFNRVYQ